MPSTATPQSLTTITDHLPAKKHFCFVQCTPGTLHKPEVFFCLGIWQFYDEGLGSCGTGAYPRRSESLPVSNHLTSGFQTPNIVWQTEEIPRPVASRHAVRNRGGKAVHMLCTKLGMALGVYAPFRHTRLSCAYVPPFLPTPHTDFPGSYPQVFYHTTSVLNGFYPFSTAPTIYCRNVKKRKLL